MTRSQVAFIQGVLGKVVMIRSPSDLNRIVPRRSSRSMARLRACCAAHAAVGRAVTPARCNLRVPCSMNTSTCNRFSSTVSTTRKSHAMTAWARVSRTPARLAQLFELYDVKPRQRAAADLHETSGVMQSAEVDGRESHRVGKR